MMLDGVTFNYYNIYFLNNLLATKCPRKCLWDINEKIQITDLQSAESMTSDISFLGFK